MGEQSKATQTKMLKDMNRNRAELEAVVDAYDKEVGDREDKRQEIAAAYASEAAQLKKLEEHFDVVDAENKRIEEEAAILKAIKDRDDAARKILDDAATMMQKHVRRKQVMAQKLLAGKKKKGKKGKKGKKKK